VIVITHVIHHLLNKFNVDLIRRDYIEFFKKFKNHIKYKINKNNKLLLQM